MKVKLYMASSLNGMIARENGSEDFLSDVNWKTFLEVAEKAGCFIIGRSTYEAVSKWPDYNFDDVKAVKIVVSKNSSLKIKKGYLLASYPKDALNKAQSAGFKEVILTGGSKINSSFLQDHLIDEVIVNIEPSIVGKGIKIFDDGNFDSRLKLLKVKKLNEEIVQLHYKLNKNA